MTQNWITKNGMYIDDNMLNDNERKYGILSYGHAWERITNNAPLVLMNNIVEVDTSVYDNVIIGSLYDEEEDEYEEVYQWYATSLSNFDIDYIRNNYEDEFIITYSDLLDTYFLAVTHWGTSWDYVDTGIKIERC